MRRITPNVTACLLTPWQPKAPLRFFVKLSSPLYSSGRTLTFDLAALPPALQAEFDTAANVRALHYLAARRRRDDGQPVELCVLPTWAHSVAWRCVRCGGEWSARPSERVDPQMCDQHGCPHCAGVARSPISPPSVVRSPDLSKAGGHARGSTEHPDTRPAAAAAMADSVKSNLLAKVYPTLAAQWDLTRNTHPHNRVGTTLAAVSTASAAKVWWTCSLCESPWREAVASRVARHEAAVAMAVEGAAALRKGRVGSVPLASAVAPTTTTATTTATTVSAATFVSLCPSCERRGAMDRVNCTRPPPAAAAARQTLADDPLLLSEAQLRPHQDPAAISLHSEVILSWQCRTCAYDFQASVAGRHDRHERCPQCSGRVQTPLNLLVIQRPDVVREVSRSISRTRLCHLTVFDDTLEVPFVCRTCLSPYRMTAKARCAVEPGGTACPKCLLALSQTIAAAPSPQLSLRGQTPRCEAGVTTAGRSRREQRRITEAARRLSASGRNRERMKVTQNELTKRDKMLRN